VYLLRPGLCHSKVGLPLGFTMGPRFLTDIISFWNNTTPDLFVSGPNEGNNLGPFIYALSGTVGSTYSAVERGIPGIAFSAGNATHRPYTAVSSNCTNDVATLNAAAAVKVVQQLATKSGRLLPTAYGLNVNLPVMNSTCTLPKYIQTRMTGGAVVGKAVYNATSGIFTFGTDVNPAVNTCINGDCSLPGETNIVLGCSVSVSVFTTDYDAPTCNGVDVRTGLLPLVQYLNGTTGSSGGGNVTATRSSTPVQATNAGSKMNRGGLAALAGLAAGVVAFA